MDNLKIEKMRRAGSILGEVLSEVVKQVSPGMTELDVDKLAEELILKKGGFPGFKKVPGYKHAICISVNDVVVHGIPTKRIFKAGDIVGVDCGVFLGGYHTDMAETIVVGGKTDPKIEKFLKAGKRAVFEAIKVALPGNRVGNLSEKMQTTIESGGGSVVRSLVGHGVGKRLHEPPEIPGYLNGPINKTPALHVGQTLAIEIIYNMGSAEVVYSGEDDWTIVTEDGSLSGLFERTIAITESGPELLTRLTGDSL